MEERKGKEGGREGESERETAGRERERVCGDQLISFWPNSRDCSERLP